MKDPFSGVARILKPNLGFEALFQGLTAASPTDNLSEKIPFFEWPDRQPPASVRDPLAGKDGFDPDLIRYVNVPKGSTLQLFIPYITPGFSYYRYWVSFRDTSLFYGNKLVEQGQAVQSHIPYTAPGQPDTTSGTPVKRYILLAGLHSVAMHQPEPPATTIVGGVITPQTAQSANNLSLRAEPLIPRPSELLGCYIEPGVRGQHQQGVVDPAVAGAAAAGASGGTWFEIVAQGDQMLIACDRAYTGGEGTDPVNNRNWDFTDPNGIDRTFANVYGRYAGINPPVPELGIYLYTVAH